uniref:Uncharacterized protein n=1 Tax=Hyaloperonospora arabidopsidis (strain Emoy2) TaxID=559515 RepID=M4B1Y6_HYAAE
MYVLPYSSSVRSQTLLALSRLVIGFGAGNRSVCRANIAMLTRVDQRLEYFTLFATVVFLAYALNPGLGSVIGETQIEIATDLLQFNRFTAPGFLLVALNLFTILVNNQIYDESVSRGDAPGSPTVIVSVPASSESTKPSVNELTIVVNKLEKSTDIVAKKKPTQEVTSPILSDQAVTVGMLVFIFLNFITHGILSIFETVNVPLFLQLTDRNTI